MPIHLHPISRRQFLARSLAASAGLALGPDLLAAKRTTDENSWALLADPHLAGDRTLVSRGVRMAYHFTNVSQEVLGLPKRPAGLFIVGDCAYNTGEPGDYAVLADLLGPIRNDHVPVHLALGNHDHRDRFWEAFEAEKAAKRPVLDKQTALISTRRVNWLVLDSLETTLATPGLLGPEQLVWLAKTLDSNQRKPAIVLVHHNPELSGTISGLKDTQAMFDLLRPRKQVKAIIFGHTHVWNVAQDPSGIHLVNLPPVSYVFKEGNPSGWVHARLDRENLRLELHCIDATHKANGQVLNLAWRVA